MYEYLALILERDHLALLTAWRVDHPSKSAIECIRADKRPPIKGQ